MINIKTKKEVEIMAEGGKRLGRVLSILAKEVAPGMEAKVLDDRARELMEKEGVKPAFLNYRPHGAKRAFPASLCVSINDLIVHGVPGNEVFKDGDVVKLDIGAIYKDFYTDTAITVGIGNISEEAERLLSVTKSALEDGIRELKPKNTLGDVGWAIHKRIKESGFSVIKSLTGHGIGQELHEDPYVFNIGQRGEGEKLLPGMVFALEPMVATGSGDIKQLPDDSFATRDGSISAQFEHTVAVTEYGPKILTARPE